MTPGRARAESRRRWAPAPGHGSAPRRAQAGARGRHLLVTGFEPFGADHVNPSQELAKILDGRRAGDASVRALVLPVQHEAAREMLEPALDAPGLAAVVHLGLAGGCARISLEAVALNTMDYSMPDAAGAVRRDEACVPGGPAAYWSTLPVRAILRELTVAGIPAAISYTAGTYLCNFTLYSTLHHLAGGPGRERVRAGFVHVPYLPAMVAGHGLEEPSMDLGVMLRAVEIALAELTRS